MSNSAFQYQVDERMSLRWDAESVREYGEALPEPYRSQALLIATQLEVVALALSGLAESLPCDEGGNE